MCATWVVFTVLLVLFVIAAVVTAPMRVVGWVRRGVTR